MKKSNNGLKIFFGIIAGIFLLGFLDYFMSFHTSAPNRYVPYGESSSQSGIIDENGLFDNDPQALSELVKRVKQCSANTHMNILIYLPSSSRKNYSDDDTRDFTANKYNEIFGENTDGLLYYIDISGKSPAYDDIAKSAGANLIYTEDVCQSIFYSLDQFLPPSYGPVSTEHIINTVNNFCPLVESYYDPDNMSGSYYDSTADTPVYVYSKGGKTYVTTSKPPATKLFICIIAELIGGLITLIMYLISKHNYKFKSKTNPGIYLSDRDVRFIEKSDTFLRSYVTKHRIQSSSGGGGGYRGGGGGHSHGGSIGHSGHHR